jgi:pimeloyl-ACP methyl ester carboxylesterase
VALSPHRPGRMPVVFVHGTASSAARWADLVNDLLSDPRIRDTFEFWFFTKLLQTARGARQICVFRVS